MNCPICRSTRTHNLIHIGPQPSSVHTLGQNKQPKHVISLDICSFCGHVWNALFEGIDYTSHGCSMYNGGNGWQDAIENRWLDTKYDGLVIDVGAGDGQFLKALKADSKLVFEPSENSVQCEARGLETIKDYFQPLRDIPKYKPQHIFMRHVLEHMSDPSAFVEELYWACEENKIIPSIHVEVPCVTKALRTIRIEDWVYEHPHHFTMHSLCKLFENFNIHRCRSIYSGEVLTLSASNKLAYPPVEVYKHLKSYQKLGGYIKNARKQLRYWYDQGEKIVFWGGAGKGATFLNTFDFWDFPVLDSDQNKVGCCVPGSDVVIQPSSIAKGMKPDKIIITTSWRAGDIKQEIQYLGIEYGEILIFKNGKFVEC